MSIDKALKELHEEYQKFEKIWEKHTRCYKTPQSSDKFCSGTFRGKTRTRFCVFDDNDTVRVYEFPSEDCSRLLLIPECASHPFEIYIKVPDENRYTLVTDFRRINRESLVCIHKEKGEEEE